MVANGLMSSVLVTSLWDRSPSVGLLTHFIRSLNAHWVGPARLETTWCVEPWDYTSSPRVIRRWILKMDIPLSSLPNNS
jgi:hypothetical protein